MMRPIDRYEWSSVRQSGIEILSDQPIDMQAIGYGFVYRCTGICVTTHWKKKYI